MLTSFQAILLTMRPRQWTKNAVIFAALVFDRQFNPGHIPEILRTIAGFIIFCLLSGVVYLINDIADAEADRRHPDKRRRPIASGALSPRLAGGFAFALLSAILPAAYFIAPAFFAVSLSYLLLNLAYSRWIKHLPLLDVFSIALGFVLRVAGGVTLIHVARFSPWLYVVTTLASLYIGFGKRRAELALLAEGANNARRVLDGYTIPLLDQYIVIVSATTIITYSLYTFSAPNLPDNHIMMLTIPFVIYGILRYLYLIQVKHSGGAPEEVLLSDRPLQATIALWGMAVLAIFYLY
jgi:4-hydroxybenzoate polyprenyltransferase